MATHIPTQHLVTGWLVLHIRSLDQIAVRRPALIGADLASKAVKFHRLMGPQKIVCLETLALPT